MSYHVHKSSTSQASRSTNFINSIEELSEECLVKQVTDLKYQIKVLTLENDILEKTIMRLEPALMSGVQQAIDYANKIHTGQTAGSSLGVNSFVKSQTSRFALDSMTSPSRMLTSPSKISAIKKAESSAKFGGTVIFGTGPKINVLERTELVSQELNFLINILDKAKMKAAKKQALLKAQLEEVGIRVTDIKKAGDMFKQMVIVEGYDRIAQRIPAEIWIRCMTEWVKISDSQIGKLRLRTSTHNTQYSKLTGQISIKAELSDALRPVDFEKTKIENQINLELIDKKLVQLAELKKMTGDANLNLAIHKRGMMQQNNYLTKILETIQLKKTQVVALDKEREVIATQAESLAEKLKDVKKVRLTYEVPDVMDYVNVKSELTDLKHSVKTLENRMHIQLIALTSLNKQLNLMMQSETPIQCRD